MAEKVGDYSSVPMDELAMVVMLWMVIGESNSALFLFLVYETAIVIEAKRCERLSTVCIVIEGRDNREVACGRMNNR